MSDQPQVEVVGERKTNWWLVLGGVVLVIFAIGTFGFPELFLEVVTIWAGVGFLFSGISGAVTFFQYRGLPGSIWTLLLGILDVVVGVMMLVHPVVFAPVIPWILGVSFAVLGAAEIAGTASLGVFIPESRPIMVVSGILLIIVGIMFVVWPSSLSLWIAAFAAVRGITLIVTGFLSRS